VNSKLIEASKLIAILAWLAFTVTFAVWWFALSTSHVETLAQLQPEQFAHWENQRRMLIWEGSAWLLLLISGGVALIWLVQREKRRRQQIAEFFASFSHDIKTSLASLRLQAEALQEDPANTPILNRLVGATVRLQLQLENSLFLASQIHSRLYLQDLSLKKILEPIAAQWPGLQLSLNNNCELRGDERALHTILSNLTQNAILHGKATEIRVKSTTQPGGRIAVDFSDNGLGYQGPTQHLAQLFHRPRPTSGSGIGLYISRELLKKMNGQLSFHAEPQGFRVHFELEGRSL